MKMSPSLCFLLITLTLLYTTVQTSSNGSLKIDLAVVIHGRAHYWISQMLFDMMNRGLRIPFPVAPRIGVVFSVPSGETESPEEPGQLRRKLKWRVGMNLTDVGNREECEKRSNEMYDNSRFHGSTWDSSRWYDGFKMAEESLFIKEPGNIQRPQAILLITAPSKGSLNVSLHIDNASLIAAREMRERGIHMFAFYHLNDTRDEKAHVDRLMAIFGDRGNLQQVVLDKGTGGITEVDVRWLKRIIVDVLCGHVQRCFFCEREPQKQCQKAWYTPNLTDAQGDCTKVDGFTTRLHIDAVDKSCSLHDCETTCNDLWSPEIVCRQENKCGQEFTREDLPRWKQLQNCSHTVKCPACSTTNTATSQDVPSSPPGAKTTTCNEKNPPEFYYDGFDGARRSVCASDWVILVAVLIVIV